MKKRDRNSIDEPPADVPDDREAAAVYIADLASDLARIARRQGFDTLGYILDMARLEARNVAGLDVRDEVGRTAD
jgi:hypothetical protein